MKPDTTCAKPLHWNVLRGVIVNESTECMSEYGSAPANALADLSTCVEHASDEHQTSSDSALARAEEEAQREQGAEVLAKRVHAEEDRPQEDVERDPFRDREPLQCPVLRPLEDKVPCDWEIVCVSVRRNAEGSSPRMNEVV